MSNPGREGQGRKERPLQSAPSVPILESSVTSTGRDRDRDRGGGVPPRRANTWDAAETPFSHAQQPLGRRTSLEGANTINSRSPSLTSVTTPEPAESELGHEPQVTIKSPHPHKSLTRIQGKQKEESGRKWWKQKAQEGEKWWKSRQERKKRSKKNKKKTVKKYKDYSPSYTYLRQTDTESDPDVETLKLIELTEAEEEFFSLVASGNVQAVKEWISIPHHKFQNPNVVNMEGNTVLHIAVSRQDEAMVEILAPMDNLNMGVITDVLLYAIMERNIGLVRTVHQLLQERAGKPPAQQQKQESPNAIKIAAYIGGAGNERLLLAPGNFIEMHKEFMNSKFHEHITPMLLAAKIGSYEMIEYFNEHGDSIPQPHKRFCSCMICSAKGGELQRCYRRLHTYQAICNPYYLCFQAIRHDKFDPILEAFKLVNTLEKCLEEEPSFQSFYEDIINDLKTFTCDLVEQCRTSAEIELLLKQKQGYGEPCDLDEPELYPRAALAIEYGQKEFISHQFVQMVLYQQWAGDWPEWKIKSSLMKVLHTIIRIPFLPLLAIILLLSNFGRSIRAPVNKCVNSMGSYIVFLAFLFVISVTRRNDTDRGPPRTGVEWPIVIWEFGHMHTLFVQAVKTPGFFKSKWTYVEIFMHLCFIAVFICWIVAYFSTYDARVTRSKWPNPYEPILIAECFFAVAEILSYAKVLRILQLHGGLGPVITSLGQMVKDVIHICMFFIIVICSFAMGLNYIYRHLGEAYGENQAFLTFTTSVATLFWSLYALGGDPVHMEDVQLNNGRTNYLKFTRGVGEVIYESYYIIGTIFLLNLLLAAMANTYDGVTSSGTASVEWNFVRASDEENVRNLELRFDYYNLVFKLVYRYFRDKAETSSVQPASTDDLQALNEDLAELRSAMRKDSKALDLGRSLKGVNDATTNTLGDAPAPAAVTDTNTNIAKRTPSQRKLIFSGDEAQGDVSE